MIHLACPQNREEEPVVFVPARSGACRRLRLARPEAFLVEVLLLAPHEIHRPRQFRCQDAERLAGAAFLLLPLLPGTRPLADTQKPTGRLAEGPTQMGVADLLAAGTQHLAR